MNVNLERVDLYDLVERRLIGAFPTPNWLYELAFDPSGRWLAGSTGAGEVWAIDMEAVAQGTAVPDALILDLVAHEAGVTGLDVSADGTLASVGLGEEVRLWDLDTGELLVELPTHPPAGSATLAFSPDASYLLYTDGDVLRRYLLDTEQLVRLARSLVTRELTPQECATFLVTDCAP